MPAVTEAHVEARRKQILKAAYRRFAAEGFHRTTVKDVADEAGLSTGALYRYFEGKEALLGAVAEATRETEAELLADLDEEGGTEPLEAVTTRFIRVLEEPWARPAIRLAARIPGEALDLPWLRAQVERSNAELVRRLGRQVRSGQERGEMDPALDPEATAAALVALIRGAAFQKMLDPQLDLAAFADAVGAFLRGCRITGDGRDREGEDR